jgi:hypothetical protein
VLYSLAGYCTARASEYSCRVSLVASNGLISAGYVSVFPSSNHGEDCRSSGALVHDSLTVNGTCTSPYASKILAVYSLSAGAEATRLAAAYIPWA